MLPSHAIWGLRWYHFILFFCCNSTTPRCRVLTLGHQDPGVFDISAVANAALAPAPQETQITKIFGQLRGYPV